MSWTYEQGLSRMAAFCSTAEHCEYDVRQKLQKAALSVEDIDAIVKQLFKEGFLDNARYCRAYADDQLRFAHWGRVKIQQGLRMKGLPEADISTAIDLLDGEEYHSVLSNIIKEKERTLDDDNDYLRRGKLIRFAAGRGFTVDEILRAMEE